MSLFVVMLLLVWAGSGCNSTQQANSTPPSTTPPPAAVSVSISPAFTELKRGTSKKFSALVGGVTDDSVTWSIQEGSAGGEITSDGVYTASGLDGQYHITATSNAVKTKSATATVIVAASVFTVTGAMNEGRFDHTATLLLNGQVLVAGGFGEDGPIAENAELYNPATGVFRAAGKIARASHTATRLANGDVLFAGGVDNTNNPLSSAQILRADTGLIETTGSMTIPRAYHAATLLDDGRVLITGGMNQGGTQAEWTNTAEIYDPASGTFSQTADMNEIHSNHSAILLSTGKVLVLGDLYTPAELYDPAAGTFTITASQPAARSTVTATMLADGRVLLTGGLIGFVDLYTGPSELFDPVTEQFSTTGALITPRWVHTATLLPDGTVLIAGGAQDQLNYEDDPLAINATEIYDPATGAFRPGPVMLYLQAGHTATLLPDGSVLLAGGYNEDNVLNSAELYK